MVTRNFSISRIYYSLVPLLCLMFLAACTNSGESVVEVAPSDTPSDNSSEAKAAIVITPFSARYEVIADIANLRSGPGSEYAEAGKVSEGEIIHVSGVLADGEWYRLEGKEEKWILASFVSPVVETAKVTAESTQEENRAPMATPTATDNEIRNTPTEAVNSSTPTQTPCARHLANWDIYTVQPGDNLLDLSRRIDFSVEGIMYANCMENTRLDIGQTLSLPRLSVTAVPTDTPTPIPSATPAIVYRSGPRGIRPFTPQPYPRPNFRGTPRRP